MAAERQELFRKIPGVDRLLLDPRLEDVSSRHPRTLLLKAIHLTLDGLRETIVKGKDIREEDLEVDRVAEMVLKELERISRPSLRPVINATGVVVHTNLGRSLMAESVLRRFRPLSGGYSNLEYDLEQGKRGSRYVHVEDLLVELTGAEAAMVVNNNAAAVLICLDTLARGREVVVSRGQLVEIGGSFRIPDVMRKSGATMVEVGTTNKTHLSDYEQVIGPDTALLLKVHKSNFQVVGFTEDVPMTDLVELGKRYGIPVMEDLGSGCLVDLLKYGLVKEPTVQETLAQGADLVSFSGDKLLGGPQAGIIVGRKSIVDAIRKNQLNRALRIDKLTLLALEETLRLYRDEHTAVRLIPTLRMMLGTYRDMVRKAERLRKMIGNPGSRSFKIEMEDGNSRPGGGSLPLLELPTRLLCLVPGKRDAQFMERWLRAYDPPIIARVEKERVVLDVRTIQSREFMTVAEAVRSLAKTRG
ncbi:MAG: L-seryl-tRNA(Sec) selenium transferase [Deltaproteobacteria bacterium]|nr:MAG: L-seryl-tRNA(Sec) selenium transferase [Deltaproteobacteria bacterium]